jgi:hypothetical protein
LSRRWRPSDIGSAAYLFVITGDVFDSAALDPQRATDHFIDLHADLMTAAGGDVPTVIIPGNHDRRKDGVLAPHRREPFSTLKQRLAGRVFVHDSHSPFLCELVPPELYDLPLWILTYDSAFLPHGLLSAGGMLRQEDLLFAAARLDNKRDWPVLFLLHHHLVPTPLTDVGPVETEGLSRVARFAVEKILPRIVAHADKEELTMTALGAGTALSTLHSLGRAVVVMHGHKHYANARLLDATFAGQGDVMIISAGSSGTAQAWSPSPGRDAARLWPSFNLAHFFADRLFVETASFAFKGSSRGNVVHRPLIQARRDGAQWLQLPVRPLEIDKETEGGARFELNESRYTLSVSRLNKAFCDVRCRRTLVPIFQRAPRRYFETVEGPSEATLRTLDVHDRVTARYEVPTQLELSVSGVTPFEILSGVRRTFASVGYGETPFSWLGLMNRYACRCARLSIEGIEQPEMAFASATDLGSGLERPLQLQRRAGKVIVELLDCPPRTWIRVRWPL